MPLGAAGHGKPTELGGEDVSLRRSHGGFIGRASWCRPGGGWRPRRTAERVQEDGRQLGGRQPVDGPQSNRALPRSSSALSSMHT